VNPWKEPSSECRPSGGAPGCFGGFSRSEEFFPLPTFPPPPVRGCLGTLKRLSRVRSLEAGSLKKKVSAILIVSPSYKECREVGDFPHLILLNNAVHVLKSSYQIGN